MFLLYLSMVLMAQTLAQLVGSGICPCIAPMKNINSTKILGEWYEWARIENIYEPDYICGMITYVIGFNGNPEKHVEAIDHVTGAKLTWDAEVTGIDGMPQGVSKLQYSNDGKLDFMSTLVEADWDHWAVFHSCQIKNDRNFQFLWVLTKTVDLDEKSVIKIKKIIEQIDIPWEMIVQIEQHDCPGRWSQEKQSKNSSLTI